MEQKNKMVLQVASPYNATIIREQCLFYEVRCEVISGRLQFKRSC